MKYLKKFESLSEYNTFQESENYILPNVSYVSEGENIFYNPFVEVLENGVYIMAADGKIVDKDTTDPTALGVVLVTDNQRILISKADATDGTNNTLYWGYNLYGKDVAGITNIDSSDAAKADFNGKANTAAIIAGYTEHSVEMDSRDMCKILTTYAEGGFTDWYVPAAGQLALMYLAKTDINAALTKIGGTTFADNRYWSSSGCSGGAWSVYFNNGGFGENTKNGTSRVRFVRDI